MALGATDIQRRWILSSNGDGTFDIQLNSTNPLYSDYYLFENATNTVAFTNDTTEQGVKWAFQSIMQINDPAFSTGIAATSTTQSVTSTSTSASASSTGTTSASSTSSTPTSSSTTSPASTSSKSSGLSSGASAGIGIGIALVVIALAALAFFLFRKRRRQQKQPHELHHDEQRDAAQDYKAPYQDAVYRDPPSELHDQSVAELDHTPYQSPVAELGTERESRG